ncbi:MAG: 23S rRNA (guanosine(2251)-2'-O)-methyltransferase RlmB [Erysipelotrichaceae bacterium]|nr:23S rRNA (guanosine(2251)-2'-O)-methyltransferase RlmB [Erysipelotrichaceae bacterium]
MAQYIYGKNVVSERIKSKKDIEQILLVDNFSDSKVLKLLSDNKLKITYIDSKKADKLSNKGLHQGILAKVKSYEYRDYKSVEKIIKDKKDSIVLIADGIEDPHNFGAILRTCDAIGVDAVFVPKFGNAPLNDTVAKVSTGAIEHVRICQVTNLNRLIEDLKTIGYWLVGAEEDNSLDYRQVDYKGKIALVVGSEGKGISKLVLKNCDFKVNLPMVGHVNSLNVSVATGILLYQIHSQQNPL